jgi:hypothetical protein
MDRGMKTYEKLGKRRSKAGRGSDSGSGLSGMGDGKADGTRSVPATGNGREDCGRIGSSNLLTSRRDASFAGPNSTMVEVHASDIVACAGFLPERVAPRALAAEKMEIATELVYPASTPPGLPLTSGGENGAGLRVGGVTEDDGTADGPGEGFIAGGGSDVASAVLVSRSPGDCPLTPALSRREREFGNLTSEDSQAERLNASGTPLTPALSRREREFGNLTSEDLQTPGDSPLTPTLFRRERESDVGRAAELEGAAPGDLTSAHEDPDGGEITNEANFDDDVRIPQITEIVDVTVDSGDGSGLDKLRTKPKVLVDCDGAGLSGPLTPRPPLAEGGRGGAVLRVGAVTGPGPVERDPALQDCDGTALGVQQQPPRDSDGGGLSGPQPPGHPNPNSEIGDPKFDGPHPPQAPLSSEGLVLRVGAMGASTDEPLIGGRGGSALRGEENALLEMEQEVFREIEKLKAAGMPVDDILKEVMSASAELHAYLERERPRGP